MKDIFIYSTGFCYASVCAKNSLTVEEITEKLNTKNPTGLDHGWEYAKDESFKQGNSNPCPCEDNPKTRKHYLFHC